MPDTPAISIIVPVYNAAEWLGRCVDSIIAQTFSDWELLLVDDGSRDSSGEICDRYAAADTRIRAIHQPNGGASRARNTGIDAPRGTYVCFVDSDDWLETEYLADLIDYQSVTPPHCDLVISGYSIVRDGRARSLAVGSRRFDGADGIAAIFSLPEYHHLTGTPFGKLFSRSIITGRHLHFHEGIHLGEDTMFVLEYMLHCDSIQYSAGALYNYDIHPGSLSARPCSLESAWLELNTSEAIAAQIRRRYGLGVAHPYLTFQCKVHYGRLLDAITREPRRRVRLDSLRRLDIAHMRLVNTPYTAWQRLSLSLLYGGHTLMYDLITRLRQRIR